MKVSPCPVPSGLGLDVLKIIALVAMVYDHALKVVILHDPGGSTLLGRVAFPLFLMTFLWALPGLLARGQQALWRITWRWLPPALLAQYPFQVMLVPSHGLPGGDANILITFLMLLWLAWFLHQGWVIRSLVMVLLTSWLSWNASYAFIGPLAVLIFMGLTARSDAIHHTVRVVSQVAMGTLLLGAAVFLALFVATAWVPLSFGLMMGVPWLVMLIMVAWMRPTLAERHASPWQAFVLILALVGWFTMLKHGLLDTAIILGLILMLSMMATWLPSGRPRLLPAGFMAWGYALHLGVLMILALGGA